MSVLTKYNHKDQFPEEMIYWKQKSQESTVWDLYDFNLVRTDILDQFENVFCNYDYILSPVTCCMPVLNSTDRNTKGPKTINGKSVESLINWCQTFLANMVGYPAASLPVGIGNNNLPAGVQLIGKKFNDKDLLLLCKMYEIAYPWNEYYKIIS